GWFQTLGLAWANVGSTPFREYKHFVHEGGAATPFIARWPSGIPAKGEIRRQFGYLPDLMATAVALSGATYPTKVGDKAIPPMEGVSLLPAFSDREPERKWPVFLEHEGNRAVFDGDRKLVSKGGE